MLNFRKHPIRKLPEPGDDFEKYHIEKRLGKGGMGAVYLVRHKVLDSLFALKILFPEAAEKNPVSIDSFIREAKLAVKLHHPNLVAVFDAGLDRETKLYYLVMEYIPGQSLRDKLKQVGRLTPDEALPIARGLASALEAAHLHHTVHRDIKPDNIMFAADGSVKLADLGIAKSTEPQDAELTLPSAVFGTPAYMSPEQALSSGRVDCRADLFSLGVVFYEMLAGQRPYRGENSVEILSQIVRQEELPDIQSINPAVPEIWAKIISRLCEKNPDRRFQTPGELSAILAELAAAPSDSATTAANAAHQDSPLSRDLIQFTAETLSPPEPTAPTLTVPEPTLHAATKTPEPTLHAATKTPEPMLHAATKTPEPPFPPTGIHKRRNRIIPAAAALSIFGAAVAAVLLFSPNATENAPETLPEAAQLPPRIVRPAPHTAMRTTPPPALPRSGDIVLIGGRGAVSEALTARPADAETMPRIVFCQAENFSLYRKQLKRLLDAKPSYVLLMPSTYYAEQELSRAGFEMLIRGQADLLRDAQVPFAFILEPAAPDTSGRTGLFNAAVRDLCALRTLPMLDFGQSIPAAPAKALFSLLANR